jgi:hypothetical protein
MFRDYVLGPRGVVDLDRARLLMDQRLARRSIAFIAANWPELEARGASSKEQAFFDHYCERHLERYGTAFPPPDDPCLR